LRWNNAAANKKKPPTKNIKFSWNLMSLVLVFFNIYSAITPNKAIETTIGPIVVPNEFIPPARFNLLDAECGSQGCCKRLC
jgi:hypothetical protein